MNRKNLTAAVLAGLAGAAGIAGTAQAVNLNPDGLGQVLIYPYYTSNAGNDTLLSVVNTSGDGKAVKVRFKEGFNSREVLDFNMYMSAYDVWVAAISDINGVPNLIIPDSTCTVPYLFADNFDANLNAGVQPFLPFDYTGPRADGGPDGIDRAAEGYFEMIEMGTLTNDSETKNRLGTADAVTHAIDDTGVQAPADCEQLVDNWTINPDGMWIDDPDDAEDVDESTIDITRNSGGLFGGAAIINVGNGTMFSYDAKAIQGYDRSADGNHQRPGGLVPNLADGDATDATVFFGAPRDEAATFHYLRSIDAVSAVFMHANTMNEYNIEAGLAAASEWVITFPTKQWYVDDSLLDELGDVIWIPNEADLGCNGWNPGEPFPTVSEGTSTQLQVDEDGKVIGGTDANAIIDWEPCVFLAIDPPNAPVPPFTSVFDGEACEPFDMTIWDREENSAEGNNDSGKPIVSPPPPGGGTDNAPNEICYEVNVLRFGNNDVFRPVFGTTSALLKTVDTGSVPFDNGTDSKARQNGWATIDWNTSGDAVLCEDNPECFDFDNHTVGNDFVGLQGLPVTGFWAEQFENGFLGTPGNQVLANYGGLFQHKGNVRRSGVQSSMD